MHHSATHVYQTFRTSMLAKTNNWQELLTEDVTLIGPLAQVAGKAAFIEVNVPFFASIQTSELLEMIETESGVATRITTTVALPDGERLTLEVSEWYRMEAGKIRSLRVYFDTAEFRKALGMP